MHIAKFNYFDELIQTRRLFSLVFIGLTSKSRLCAELGWKFVVY